MKNVRLDQDRPGDVWGLIGGNGFVAEQAQLACINGCDQRSVSRFGHAAADGYERRQRSGTDQFCAEQYQRASRSDGG
ncbi:MAG TPA: hypothetical protein VF583_28635 [Bradyrhizobium sp.]